MCAVWKCVVEPLKFVLGHKCMWLNHINSHVYEWVSWCVAFRQRCTFTYNPMIHCLHHKWKLLQARVAISALFTTLNLTSLLFKSETWNQEPNASPTHVDLAENLRKRSVRIFQILKNEITNKSLPHFTWLYSQKRAVSLEYTCMLLQARTAVNPLLTTTNWTNLPFKSTI